MKLLILQISFFSNKLVLHANLFNDFVSWYISAQKITEYLSTFPLLP